MEINKSSWHYRMFEWSYTWDGRCPPINSNLCSYVRRLAVGVPLNGVVWAMLFLSLGMIVALGNICLFPFGYYVRHPQLSAGSGEVASYRGLRLGKFYLLPWHILLPVGLGFLGWWNYHMISQHKALTSLAFFIEMVGVIMALVIGSLILYARLEKNPVVQEYIDAKTKGICPLITFKDDQ